MGNHFPTQTFNLNEIFEENSLYSYNVFEDVFHLKIKFLSVPNLKRALQFYCTLSCIDASIQFIDELFISDNEQGQITTVEIEGVTSNIFKLADLCFQSTNIRYSFIEISKYEMVFDPEGRKLKWSPDRKAKIILMENAPIAKNFNEDSPKLLAKNLEKLNLENKSKFMQHMKPKSEKEEEVKNDAPLKVVNRKVSSDSGEQTMANEETFQVKTPQSDILIRFFQLDIYQKNSEFFKFAPIQKLMIALFSDLRYKTVTLLSVMSDEQSKQNIMLKNLEQNVSGLQNEVKEMKVIMNEIYKFIKKKD